MIISNSKKELRGFSYLIGVGLPLIIGWLIPVISGHEFRTWTLFVGIPVLVAGVIFPNTLNTPYTLWMKLGYVLGWFNSRIILGVIFFMVLQPISYLMKAFGYDPLRLKKSKLSSFKESKKGYRVDLTRIF